jgi:uncharacterized membrane protein YccC
MQQGVNASEGALNLAKRDFNGNLSRIQDLLRQAVAACTDYDRFVNINGVPPNETVQRMARTILANMQAVRDMGRANGYNL